MPDPESESLICRFSAGERPLTGIERAFLADLETISDDTIGTAQNSDDRVRVFIASWKAGDAARREELKNSPLVQHWAKLDADRKADGYAISNASRRLIYAARIFLEEDRIVTQYVTGLSLPAKTARRNEKEANRKAIARANETPEQAVERKRRDAESKRLKRAKIKMTQTTT
jgi:hypothetical protein